MNDKPSIMANQSESWEKSIKANGITQCVRVEAAKNGFIISYNRYGREKGKNGKEGEYIDETEKYISKTNPLAEDGMGNDKNTKPSKAPQESMDDKIKALISNSKFEF